MVLMEIYVAPKQSFYDFFLSEKESLLVTVNRLQQTLQEQCNLRGVVANTHLEPQ